MFGDCDEVETTPRDGDDSSFRAMEERYYTVNYIHLRLSQCCCCNSGDDRKQLQQQQEKIRGRTYICHCNGTAVISRPAVDAAAAVGDMSSLNYLMGCVANTHVLLVVADGRNAFVRG